MVTCANRSSLNEFVQVRETRDMLLRVRFCSFTSTNPAPSKSSATCLAISGRSSTGKSAAVASERVYSGRLEEGAGSLRPGGAGVLCGFLRN